jgi:hypothetical protein
MRASGVTGIGLATWLILAFNVIVLLSAAVDGRWGGPMTFAALFNVIPCAMALRNRRHNLREWNAPPPPRRRRIIQDEKLRAYTHWFGDDLFQRWAALPADDKRTLDEFEQDEMDRLDRILCAPTLS